MGPGRHSQKGSLLLELLLLSGIAALLASAVVYQYAFYSRAIEGDLLSSEVSRLIQAVSVLDFSAREPGADVTSVIGALLAGLPALAGEVESTDATVEFDDGLVRVRVLVEGSADLCAAVTRAALAYDIGLRVAATGQPLETVQFADGRAPVAIGATACGQARSRMELEI